MQHQLEQLIRSALSAAIEAGDLPAFNIDDVGLERPQDASHGDWSATLAMRSARLAHMAPRALAEKICAHLQLVDWVKQVEIAGPGFINFYLEQASANEVFKRIRTLGYDFGRSEIGTGTRLQVEFVSANPVGPLHIGHGRWAALGDSLCRVLDFAGYEVQREYYINDHGTQMDVFGKSLAVRVAQLLEIMDTAHCDLHAAHETLLADAAHFISDEDDTHPEKHHYAQAFLEALDHNGYGGAYIIDIAKRLIDESEEEMRSLSLEDCAEVVKERAYPWMLEIIAETCRDARCEFDVWFSERSLYEKDALGLSQVDRALARLQEAGYTYTDEGGALWFASTRFGDDKDRVLIKTNGEYTYFASDIAYHFNKFQRFDNVINIWGADHHGYIARVQAASAALGYPDSLEVLLGQLVNLLRNGEPVRMSKRKGTMVSFSELLEEVGPDATRYTLVSKSSQQMIDFDIEKVKAQNNSNPVYYVQYAHARICSILRKAEALFAVGTLTENIEVISREVIGSEVALETLDHESEKALARKLSEFESLLQSAARDRAPFRLTHYAEELAAAFHSFYASCQVLPRENQDLDLKVSKARLAAVDAVRIVLHICLELLGVSAPEKM